MRVLLVCLFLIFSLSGLIGTEAEAKAQAEKIWSIDSHIGMTFEQLEAACVFVDKIETSGSKSEIYSKKKTGLPCTIEKSEQPKGYLLRDLPKGAHIGSGFHKTIDKVVLCAKEPLVIAECLSDKSGAHEIAMYTLFQGRRGIPKFFGSKKLSKKSFLFYMEFFGDGSLASWIAEGRTATPEQQVHIATDLAIGLSAMHDAHVFHRDLHPGNILLRKNQERGYDAVLIDFGQARKRKKMRGDEVPQAPRRRNPPEALLTKFSSLDRYKADVYALGCNFYSLIQGKNPDWLDTFNVYKMDSYSSREKRTMYETIVASYEKEFSEVALPLLAKRGLGETLTTYERFRLTTFEMLNPEPEKRPSLHEVIRILSET